MSSDSFLPRIQSVFYAVFDVQQGPKIVYQVPEDLIAVSESLLTPTSPLEYNRDRSARPTSSRPALFHFDDVSKYVIPHSQLCGRLVTCSTQNHRVIGFPVELHGVYIRNYFRYNLCFVFDRSADLSCYEPVVRKVNRVLTSCEKESAFLSNPETSGAIHAILEQLYEDLNSYSETSIAIDRFNSIELKIYPFYPNPPPVHDWMVPLTLINITQRTEDNWDLTMIKVCQFIDGTNHVSRIAYLADCDIELTRLALSHLLFYQVIMMIDIFQYSNMYTLSRSMQWLADEAHVRDECGPYVTRPGHAIPDWPQLLRLYSRFKPGKTILEWMKLYGVHQLGIDVRRFTSFGIIKGFLRRVHRWPVLSPDPSKGQALDPSLPTPFPRKRLNSFSTGYFNNNEMSSQYRGFTSTAGGGQLISPDISTAIPTASQDPNFGGHLFPNVATVTPISATQRARRASAAEKVLEQLRSRDLQQPSSSGGRTTQVKDEATPVSTQAQDGIHNRRSGSRRQSLITPVVPPPSPVLSRALALPSSATVAFRQRQAWSPAAAQTGLPPYPTELLPLLDGQHHTDELAVRFGAAWPVLQSWLVAIGGGSGNGDFGTIHILYR